MARAVRAAKLTNSAHATRDPQASDVILHMKHRSGLSTPDTRYWTRILGSYRTPNHLRRVAELVITALPLVMLWTAAWFTLSLGYAWASFLIAVPAAGFLVRLFMIQRDCGHGTFFADRLANDWVGRVIGVFTLTPYDWWRRTHAIHHATTGNLDRRGIGDVDTLTVREYQARSRYCCAGSQPTSGFTTCTISAVVFLFTGCRACCATTRNCASSVTSRSCKAFGA
jgi:acyl-lipid omega-6 desaturase (Delta-12 desaturase)